MSTIQHINAYLDRIPVQMQLQVLHFIERLAQKKVQGHRGLPSDSSV